MKKRPKVSIIIPVYNGVNYMREAIDSALAQTYSNIEVIVVNDGSKDKTEEIALSYGNKIKYFAKDNGGVSTALNLGIQNMTGDFFSWLSHDDLYELNKIEIQINYLLNNELLDKKIILYSDYYLINEKGSLLNNCIKDHNDLTAKPEYALLRGAVNGLTLLIPKEAFEEHGMFDEKLRCTQDYMLWHKMFRTYKPIHMPISLVSSRYHASQVSNTSPKVISEGYDLWMMMIEDLTKIDKERLEGSEYLFYYNMAIFLQTTPYEDVQKHCEMKCDIIRKETKVNTKDILVSVIIPFFNRSTETIRAIKSVLNQTHQKYEIILINDNSTEDISLVKDFIKDKKNITLVNLKINGGPAKARNEGILIANGDYIAFLDSDDEFLPNKLEKQLKEMLITNADISHTSYIRKMNDVENIINSGVDNGDVRRKLMYSCQIATPTVMLKKSNIIKNKLFFNSNIRIGEDVCYWLTILKNKSLVGIEEELTIVNTGNENSAYDEKKQLEGTKNILTFLLTDDYYKEYNQEIAIIATSYSNFAIKTSYTKKSKIAQVVGSLRTIGLIGTLKKIYSKLFDRN